MIVPIPWVHVGMGILTILVSIPLVLRRVPMNRLYGIRLRKAFASERNWIAINARGGWLLLAFGCFLLAFGWLGRSWAPPPRSPWAPVFLVAPLLGILPVLIAIHAFARQLPD